MKIVLNSFKPKKTIILSTIGVCVFGVLLTAIRIYFKKRRRRRESSENESYPVRDTRSPSELRNLPNGMINLASEELLELGLNYLEQAIKCWETALDSIENDNSNIQGNALALPVIFLKYLIFSS